MPEHEVPHRMSAVGALENQPLPGHWPRDPKAYSRAMTHSRRVKLLKWAIPLAVFGALALLILIGLLDPFRQIPNGLSVNGYGLDGTNITMEQPRLAGYYKDGRPYMVRAKSARQDLKKQSIVDLTDMQGEFGTPEGKKAEVSASSATYDTSKNTIILRKDVLIKSDSGYVLRADHAFVDFNQNSMISDAQVSMQFKGGTVLADSMRVSDNGKVLTFEGHVQSTFAAQTGADTTTGEPPK